MERLRAGVHVPPGRVPGTPRFTRNATRLFSAALFAAVSAGIKPSPVRAQPAPPPQGDAVELSMSQYAHTSWGLRDGGPADVHAIAQTADGVLWLGGSTGLHAFDGVRFERQRLPASVSRTGSILVMTASPDGALWIGFQDGVLARLHRGRFTTITEREGLPSGATHALAVDSGGRVWVASPRGLARIEGTRAIPVGTADGFTGSFPMTLMVDGRGALWLGDADGVFVLSRGAARFTRVTTSASPLDALSMAAAPDGTVWGTSRTGTVSRLTDAEGSRYLAAGRTAEPLRGTLFIDRRGNVWESVDDGLIRVSLHDLARPQLAWPGREHRLRRADGLSGARVYCIVEDREGNVWVGTSGGVDRLRTSRFTPLQPSEEIGLPLVVPLDSGRVLVTSASRAPMLVGAGAWSTAEQATGIFASHRSEAGAIWIGGRSGLWQGTGNRFVQVPLPEAARGVITAIVSAPDGRLWISVLRRGVFRRDGATWTQLRDDRGVPLAAASALVVDQDGQAWMGFDDARVMIEAGDRLHTISRADGLRIGSVQAMHVRGGHVWMAGSEGLMLHADRRLHGMLLPMDSARVSDTLALGLTGVVERANGDVWLNGASGVLRLPSAEVQRVLRNPQAVARVEQFDARDGLDGAPVVVRPAPTAIEGTDGRLWFASRSAVAWVWPDRMQRNAVRPFVHIRGLTADDSAYGAGDSLRLPRRSRSVQVRYAAMSLSIPERVRFRVRLDGADTAWRDVGNRREMEYQFLAPGRYTFRAMAANEDGVWSDASAAITFTIPPTLTQTPGFAFFCAMVTLLVAYGAYALRLRRQSQAMRARFDVTLTERTRIAQDLHDTLLQGFTGITLQLQGLQDTIARRPDRAPAILTRIMESADAALREARYAVWDMRDPAIDPLPLPELLGNAARALVDGTAIALHLGVEGQVRSVTREVETTALRIVREGVINAVKHAAPTSIELELVFEADMLTLRVLDDGRGLARPQRAGVPQHGHWGIMGMRDRVARLGGTLQLDDRHPRGTALCVTLPLGAGAPESSSSAPSVVRADVAVLPPMREPAPETRRTS